MFIIPPASIYEDKATTPGKDNITYTAYNYLGSGIVPSIKRNHFEVALRLTNNFFHKCDVIDFGCADGAFIPSLAKYFNHVVAIDIRRESIEICSNLVSELSLNNVTLFCNDKITIDDIRSRIGRSSHILYLLETLEHIGDKSDLFGSKIDFLTQLFTLLDDDGIIVISVPKMIGIPFLLQRLGLRIFRSIRDPISIINLAKSVLGNTTALEWEWSGGHLGFNHKKLEILLRNEFKIVKKKNLLFQVEYVIKKC